MLVVALALALLPGLVVVRAPWTAIAPISLAFWVLGPWWPPLSTASRGRLLAGALLASAVLAALRLLPKRAVAPPPAYPPPRREAASRPGLDPPPLAAASSLLLLGTALALLLFVPLWPHAPGPGLAFQTTAARLVVWRDAVPRSFEPLLPLEPFGAHAPALATLAADVSLLTGHDPAPSLVAVVAAAAGLALLGLFALNAVWAPPPAAAAGALVALAAAPSLLSLFGVGEALLALGFTLPALALAVGHASRASVAAAALMLAAGMLAQPVVAALAALAAAGGRWSGAGARRTLVTLLAALLLAAPGLRPLVESLTAREAVASASAPASHFLAVGLALLLAVFAPKAFTRAFGSRSRAVRAAAAALALLAAPLLVARVHGWLAAGVLPERTRAALARAAAATPRLATVCAADAERDFVPALAGRRAGEPGVWIPGVYAEEWARRERRPCDVQLRDLAR